MNPTHIIEKDISTIIGLDGLSETEQVAYLSEIGEVVLESALTQLMSDLSDEQVEALEHFVDSEPDTDTLMQHLLSTYPQFESILEAVVAMIKSDTVAILGEGEAGDR
jgi:hypothetical protein